MDNNNFTKTLGEIFGVAPRDVEMFGINDSPLCQIACLFASDMNNKTYLKCMTQEIECAVDRMVSAGTDVGDVLVMKLLFGAIIMRLSQGGGACCDDNVKVLMAAVDTICKDSGEDSGQGNDGRL